MEPGDGPRGFARIQNRSLNKGTAFTDAERDRWGLRGLLPPQVLTMERQMSRIIENLRRKSSDIERYITLSALANRNERLFYRLVIENITELLPIIYTPTVGEACRKFANIFREPRGLYVTAADRGNVREVIANWPEREVQVMVVTDGQRILGLGDLGANGMGIPVGKLSLYVACAGIDPRKTMPVMLDVGTDNEELLADPLYLGLRQKRIPADKYDELVEEFVEAVAERFPGMLLQFEDFATPNAFRLLTQYRERVLCFNDDIQGTAAVALAGLYAAARASGQSFAEMRFLFLGAGSAATGIGNLVVSALEAEGLPTERARTHLAYVDLDGLITADRENIPEHQRPYAHPHPPADLLGAIESFKPHALIGATGAPGVFTEAVIRKMASINQQPVIFALSNPTSRAECTAEQAYQWSEGRALFASGSPFDPVVIDGKQRRPAQGNNVYVFPGVGLGSLGVGAWRISDGMFLAAARRLADLVDDEDLAEGALYPRVTRIRDVSLGIAEAVARQALDEGVAPGPAPADLAGELRAMMYVPRY